MADVTNHRSKNNHLVLPIVRTRLACDKSLKQLYNMMSRKESIFFVLTYISQLMYVIPKTLINFNPFDMYSPILYPTY